LVNLVNAERLSIGFGTRTLLDAVSLGVGRGDVVGVVGRNGDGKTTLLQLLTGVQEPDSGRVTRSGSVSIGYLRQTDQMDSEATVRTVIVGGEPDHVWAAQAGTRAVVEHLLAGVDLDAPVSTLSGGEQRRVGLAELLLADHDLLVLDEPTNHLDVDAVAWLAEQLRVRQARGVHSRGDTPRAPRDKALLVVSHDRWFLDAICTRIWEVHDGVVEAYDGGYSAYVLARAERARQAAGAAARRRNLLRKELAWLRRGPPARTSKPRFRIEAANALIADEPPPRNRLALQQLATHRLGKDVFDLRHVSLSVPSQPPRILLRDLTWSIGPGMRIGLVGANGSGKTSLLRLLIGELHPDTGTVKRGRTLQIGYLSQTVAELAGTERVLESVERLRRQTRLATGRETSASSLLEDFGFTGERLTTRLDDLSGGERRRLQFLRLLLAEPNVLLLDEPTNDLDIDNLTVLEDYLDSWPGTLLVVTHDRYFLERTCDVTYALRGDGSCVLLPGGVDQYLESRRAQPDGLPPSTTEPAQRTDAARTRQARKELTRIEAQLATLSKQIDRLHQQMADAASDYTRLAELQTELASTTARQSELEESWLVTAEQLS
jgi:ATPase subunit of ABC transporter with duplicated ATPase domains